MNARPLVSRAKREGLYCGWHSGSVTCCITGDVTKWGAKHCRAGVANQHAVPLRHLKEYYREVATAGDWSPHDGIMTSRRPADDGEYVATTKEEAEAILDKIIANGAS